jgi:hypothetical protein
MLYSTNDTSLQLLEAPKSNVCWGLLLQFAKENAEALVSTHWLLAADDIVQPVVNVPLVGSPHLVQSTFHDWVLHGADAS